MFEKNFQLNNNFVASRSPFSLPPRISNIEIMPSPRPTIKSFFVAAKNLVIQKRKSGFSSRATRSYLAFSPPLNVLRNDVIPSPVLTTGSLITCEEGSVTEVPSDMHRGAILEFEHRPFGNRDPLTEDQFHILEWLDESEITFFEEKTIWNDVPEHEVFNDDLFFAATESEASQDESQNEGEEFEENYGVPEEDYSEYYWEAMAETGDEGRDIQQDLDDVVVRLTVIGLMTEGRKETSSAVSALGLFDEDRFETVPSVLPGEFDEGEMESTSRDVNMRLEEAQTQIHEQESQRTSLSLRKTISNKWTEVRVSLRWKMSFSSLQTKDT
ncbi:uncharacterized protein EAE98_006810 [Botrytis deweyae]|uniref:Uncharacterized protein n=2 Tax=Botrytis TaxID=33196 RepID=A0A4Z1K9Y8_9HELO|nr:uncharacterized protein EAE98_006810 [Botrytis deweyae]KAF7922752.1 hypothetical protein EAE99_007329 [Botrytis elliptica]KAF7925585.1 hypothetical protein EAE98_006810 [Botrytis deweyae]TGO78063.1 hypothetical protein BELL_0080g00120 [Botrytis elliptica]